ncbi:MAG: hypothetical protein Q7R78_02005 [bacterium]|nr:hypothetical protein [bacterium]
MIYLIYGNDIVSARRKASSLVASLIAKKPDASFFSFDEKEISADIIKEYVGGQGLFENKYIVLFDGILEKKENKDILLEYLDDISKSDNIFIIREGKIDDELLAVLEKKVNKAQKYDKGEEIKEFFNVFNLADLLAEGRIDALWAEYTKALALEIPVESIHGTLFWQMKNIILASVCKTSNEAGLKEFPFSKALRGAKIWGEKRARKTAKGLVTIYHEARGEGGSGLEILLEEFILNLKRTQ